ncbi:MAG: transcriptional regulator NrdR [Chlamydiae bacterium RIFCSPHIGHO2_12_FULL_27_8]|nr:MAG: transcriptional regulator NrdR [Chlamydiae bacterium RIFCSPHIGHO2_12_FULL_27_8]
MKCPFCSFEESKVTDSRFSADLYAIKRRRECLKCSQRFTTFETVDLTIQVKKRDGTYEDFIADKLFNGIMAACRHTRVSHDKVKSLCNEITADLMSRQLREIATQELGAIVMKYLQKIDTVAYIRFACVYKRFKDIKEILDAIDSVKEDNCNIINNKNEDGLYGAKTC